MRKTKKISDAHTPSPLVVAMRLRGGAGVHADQRRKSDPKQVRRDRSYKDER